jgi:hypothetical protein
MQEKMTSLIQEQLAPPKTQKEMYEENKKINGDQNQFNQLLTALNRNLSAIAGA